MKRRGDYRTITIIDPGHGLLVSVSGVGAKTMAEFGVPTVWSRRHRAFRVRRSHAADIRAMCQYMGTYVVREVSR